MSPRFLRRVLAPAGLALLLSCESGTDPEAQFPIELSLDFCSDEVPVWIAYRNQGADWARLTPNAEGTVTFTASNRVALAFVRQDGADYDTEFVFAANTELQPISGVSCREESGGTTVNGTVSGVVGTQRALVGASYSSVYLGSQQTSFSLTGLAARPLDVVASRVNIGTATQHADRVIVRRGQALVHNASMPLLDLASAEAVPTTAFGITVSGVGAGGLAFLSSYFVSQLETSHVLSHVEPVSNGSHTAYGVPAGTLAAGDYHDAFAVVVDAEGSMRGAERFFRAPAAQTLTLGAAMGTPNITQASRSPTLRLRTRMSRAGDYSRAMRVQFTQPQQQFSVTNVFVTITSGYDAAGTWDVTMPDMNGQGGWQNAWGLVSGGSAVEWTAIVFGGRPELLFGAAPEDGEVARFASRTSNVNARVAAASRLPVTARLPRPAWRAR